MFMTTLLHFTYKKKQPKAVRMCHIKLVIVGALIAIATADEHQAEQNRAKRTNLPLAHKIYSLDNFISLVEKIERHPKTSKDSLKTIANYVRKLAYDSQLWTYLVGSASFLPPGVLNAEEERVLKNMVAHRYEGTRELGVIRTPPGETIALGHVITGICAGLHRDENLSLAKWLSGSAKTIDNLFAATVSGDLGQTGLAKSNGDQNKYFGPVGQWSTDQCPGKYNRHVSDEETETTNAEILGDMDGFIIGHAINGWAKRGVRLSQLFKMYYGDGVLYDKSYRDCNRWSKFKELVGKEKLEDEVEGFSHAYYYKYSDNYKNVKKDDLKRIAADVVTAFYKYVDNLSKTSQACTGSDQDTSCELPANIVFVVDESGSIGSYNYLKEKSFVKNIIKAFDVSVLQARVALVEFATFAKVEIGLDDYGAKTPLLCAIDQLQYNSGSTHTASAIAIVNDNILGPAQQAEGASTDTVQMVVLLTDGRSNDRWSLGREVARIKRDIKGLTMIAVGVSNYDLYELQMIATDSEKHVFTVESFDKLVELVKSLRKEACLAPANLEIDFTQTENETEIVAYVSPGKPRFFTLTADLFFGLKDIYIEITPVYGTVAVYASRITPNPGPNNYSLKIEPKGVGVPSTLHLTDLCTGYNSSDYCPPLYIGIYGEQSELSCSDLDCQLPNQIKFAIKRGAPLKSLGKKLSGGLTAIFAVVVATLFSFMRNPQSV